MAQVEESTAGLCKEIPHLTVRRQQQLAYSDEEGAQKGRKVNKEQGGVSLLTPGLPPLGQIGDPTFFSICQFLRWSKLFWGFGITSSKS